jgi:hypothetical protein
MGGSQRKIQRSICAVILHRYSICIARIDGQERAEIGLKGAKRQAPDLSHGWSGQTPGRRGGYADALKRALS